MFDLGWTELLLIGIVALIVVGPKDLPILGVHHQDLIHWSSHGGIPVSLR